MTNYNVRTYQAQFEMIELIDTSTDSSVILCPERGGIAISCILHGRELFYLDEATLNDPSANIRGGNPVLFPICGALIDGQYEWEGQIYSMQQHGLARLLKWETASLSATEHEARASLLLRSNSETLAIYPFEFELSFDYVLQEGQLRIEQTYRNTGRTKMPFYAGFHPYFNAVDGDIRYQTDGTRLFDCNDGLEKPLTGVFEADKIVESHIVLDAQEPAVSFWPAADLQVTLTYSSIFKYVVLWSIPGKPFICVEPWMTKNLELNLKQELQIIDPGQQVRAELTIHSKTVDRA